MCCVGGGEFADVIKEVETHVARFARLLRKKSDADEASIAYLLLMNKAKKLKTGAHDEADPFGTQFRPRGCCYCRSETRADHWCVLLSR